MEIGSHHKNDSPLVSVIMPTYQRAHLIGESIDSCYAQTFQNFELIVIDDGSTDDTESIVKNYDCRTRYIKLGGNSGPSKARNEGVRQARGKYIAMLDSDDLWHPTKLEKQIALIESNPNIGWVYSNLKFFGSEFAEGMVDYFHNKKPGRGMILKGLLCNRYPMITSTILVKRSCFLEIGGYDESLRTAEDTDLYNRLAHSYEADYVDEILGLNRYSEDSYRVTGKSAEHHLRVIERVLSYKPSVYSTMTYKEVDQSFVRLCLVAALHYRKERSKAACYRLLYRGLLYNPTNLQVLRCMVTTIFK